MKIKLLNENAKVPFRGSDMAAGYDLYSAEEVVIPVGECKLISTELLLKYLNIILEVFSLVVELR